jgi:hypothetical protein
MRLANKLQCSVSATWGTVPLRGVCRLDYDLGLNGTCLADILQSHTSEGHGYFLLPSLRPNATTSPITGGRVLVAP